MICTEFSIVRLHDPTLGPRFKPGESVLVDDADAVARVGDEVYLRIDGRGTGRVLAADDGITLRLEPPPGGTAPTLELPAGERDTLQVVTARYMDGRTQP